MTVIGTLLRELYQLTNWMSGCLTQSSDMHSNYASMGELAVSPKVSLMFNCVFSRT